MNTILNLAGFMLLGLGSDEVNDILRERSNVEVICEFCNATYRYDADLKPYERAWADADSAVRRASPRGTGV